MAKTDKSEDALLQTSQGNALLRWDTLLDVQVNTFLPYELQYLLRSPAWMNASRVLDAGCGNGYFLSCLQSFFPQKEYCGFDLSPELVGIAKSEFERSGLHFEVADFFKFTPEQPADFLFMRLIVQHLKGLAEVLAKASELLNVGGSLLVVEPDPSGFINFPETPVFFTLLAAIDEHGSKTNRNRAKLADFGELLGNTPGWKMTRNDVIGVSQVGPFQGTKLLEMLLLWIESLESAGEIDFPFDDAREEIEQWSHIDVSYNQIGIRFYELEKAA